MHAAVSVAVQAFRDAERTRFLADRKAHDLSLAAFALGASDATDEDRAEYFALTTACLAEYEAKRAADGII